MSDPFDIRLAEALVVEPDEVLILRITPGLSKFEVLALSADLRRILGSDRFQILNGGEHHIEFVKVKRGEEP